MMMNFFRTSDTFHNRMSIKYRFSTPNGYKWKTFWQSLSLPYDNKGFLLSFLNPGEEDNKNILRYKTRPG